jgi:acyl phosphate:glycerol-3-phosphate acyltransferase
MVLIIKVLLILGAYLIGSIPTSVWISRRFYGIDIREYGSGNAGFTNTVRVLGWKAGIPVFIIDVLKGFVAVNLIQLLKIYEPHSAHFINYQLMLGTAAVLGHIFPLYVGFKGGKGVATLLGLVMAVQPEATLICLGIFILVFVFSGYVSLSSMIAGVSFPVLIIVIFKTTVTSLVIFSLIVAVLLLLTHQKNIQRLIRNEESKAKIIKKRRPE